MMGWIRRASLTRLLAAAAVVLVVVIAGVVLFTRSGDQTKPPPPTSIGELAALVGSRAPEGVTADVTLTGELATPARTTGKIWWAPGKVRIDLGEGADQVQMFLIGDELTLLGGGRRLAATLPIGASLAPLLGELGQGWALEPPQSVVAGGKPAYDVRVVSRDSGSELGGIAATIDAQRGLPVMLTVTGADGRRALQLQLRNVHLGEVDDEVFTTGDGHAEEVPVPRRIGTGLGSVLVWRDADLPLPESLWDHAQPVAGGGEALETPAGTVLRFTRDGHTYVVAGLLTPDRLAAAAA